MIRKYLKAQRYNWTSNSPAGCDNHCIEHPCGPCIVPELTKYQSLGMYCRTTVRTLRRRLYRWRTALDYSRIEDIELDGIHHWDSPDFVDAYICRAIYKGRDMTEAELERLNEDSDFVHQAVMDRLY